MRPISHETEVRHDHVAWGCAYGRNIEFLFIFVYMRLNWRTALVGNAIAAALLVLVNMLGGYLGRHLVYFTALQVTVGCDRK